MTRDEILSTMEESHGIVPAYVREMPEAMLVQFWETTKWVEGDSALSSRDKMLVGYGAAGAVHCEY